MTIEQRNRDLRAWPALALGLCLAFGARAQQIAVERAWARATVPSQMASGAFMRLTASQDVTLIGARSPDAGSVEMHEMKMDDGIMRMRPVAAVPIRAGQTLELKSGGYHLMMMDLKRQLKVGDTVAPAPGRTREAAWTLLFLAWLIAFLATASALFLGEVMGKPPCVLCWYQRIAMFPLVVVLAVGLLDADARSARYAWPLAAAGAAVALYHCLLFWGVVSEALAPCSQGVSCADADVQVAGIVPIPLLSLIAFTAIMALLWLARQRKVTP